MIRDDQIFLRYSGGPFNDEAIESLGGLMSSIAVQSFALENLFPNVDDVNTTLCPADYRAAYVVNTSSEDTLYNVIVYLDDFREQGGAVVRLGVPTQNEIQQIEISNSDDITDGNFILKFGDVLLDITWDGVDGTRDNLEDAFRALPDFCEIEVTTTSSSPDATYQVTFSGGGRNTLQPTLTVEQRNLTTTGSTPSIYITVVEPGSPINDVATDIAFGNNPPVGITFVDTDEISAIDVGHLGPGESFYIWVERFLADTVTRLHLSDLATLHIEGETSDLKLTTLTYCQFNHLTYPQFNQLPYK